MFAPGRVCARIECATLLSIYNESEYCALHDARPERPGRGRPRGSTNRARYSTRPQAMARPA